MKKLLFRSLNGLFLLVVFCFGCLFFWGAWSVVKTPWFGSWNLTTSYEVWLPERYTSGNKLPSGAYFLATDINVSGTAVYIPFSDFKKKVAEASESHIVVVKSGIHYLAKAGGFTYHAFVPFSAAPIGGTYGHVSTEIKNDLLVSLGLRKEFMAIVGFTILGAFIALIGGVICYFPLEIARDSLVEWWKKRPLKPLMA